MNNRYQKGTEPKGVARKSAARAKPKRAIGEQNRSNTKGKSSPVKKTNDKKRSSFLREMPDTPEYKQQRKIWWGCLGASFTLLLLSLALGTGEVSSFLGLGEDLTAQISLGMTWAAMLLVGYSWYLDLKKIRPLVRAWEAEKSGGKDDAKSKADNKAAKEESESSDDSESKDEDSSKKKPKAKKSKMIETH
jgi:hypothetical protein